MLRYSKGAEPAELDLIRQTEGADWAKSLYGDQRGAVRRDLIRDQGALCAYCQRRIENSPRSMNIEHWHTRQKRKDLQFEWSNLLGVCLGRDVVGNDASEHCDKSRKENSPDLYLHPVAGRGADPLACLVYGSDGNIRSADACANLDIETLNLNALHLVRAREALWRQAETELMSGLLNPDELAYQAAACTLVQGSEAPEYLEVKRSILAWQLEEVLLG